MVSMKLFVTISFRTLLVSVIYCISFLKIAETTCSEGYFECRKTGTCIHRNYVCDRHRNCGSSDSSDEDYCNGTYYHEICRPNNFRCNFNEYTCQHRTSFCDGNNDCRNGYDEKFCDEYKTRYNGGCPFHWWQCNDGRCIPDLWKCDSFVDCRDQSDETNCVYPIEGEVIRKALSEDESRFLGDSPAQRNLVKWFTARRNSGTTTNKWGHELPRIAVALILADKGFMAPGNRTMDEMSYELSIQLLSYLAGDGEINTNDLATYIHALLATCIDPRNFYGRDLVSELRSKVDEATNTTNPFEMLVLCSAGDKMSPKDAARVISSYNTKNRPFWIDNQAMATIALTCMFLRTDVEIDERTLIDMEQELKKRQFRNGTVENLTTTALVIQALIATQSYKRDFDLEAAVKVILQSQKSDGSIGSFLDSYYTLPALSNSSLVYVSSEHCQRSSTSEEEALSEFQRTRGERLNTQYSVWIGSEMDLRKTWTLKVPYNSSLYDILEIANRLDSRQRIQYNVIDGKPFVSSLTGLQDDIQKGLYWFTCIRAQNSTDQDPEPVQESPVDVKIAPNQELILWYKTG